MSIAYEKAWVETARKMIASPRYRDGISERHLGHFDFDDNPSDDGGCDCDEDGCPICGSDDMAPDIKDTPF